MNIGQIPEAREQASSGTMKGGTELDRFSAASAVLPCCSLVVSLVLHACTPRVTDSLLDSFANSFGESVTIPESDSTPPAVSLTIPVPSGERTLRPGDAPYSTSIDADDTFFVVAAAEDSQGVMMVQVVGHVHVNCTNDAGIGQLRSFSPITTDTDEGGPGDLGLTRRWIPYRVNLDYAFCAQPQDFRLVSVEIEVFGRGTNFSGLTVETAKATFTYEP